MSEEYEQQSETVIHEDEPTSASSDTVPAAGAEDANPNTMPTIIQLSVAIAILVLVLGSSYLPNPWHKDVPAQEAQVTEAKEIEETPAPPKADLTQAFDGTVIEAEAAYVWDVKEQRALYNKNASAQLPLASLTKLMTGLVAYDIYGITGTIPITLPAIQQEGEYGFTDGEEWNSKNLLDLTLMTSSNDGAYAIAAAAGEVLAEHGEDPTAAFIKKMNARAEQIGLSQTYFTNPTGLDASTERSGSYGSARDMAFLMEYILREHPELLTATAKMTDNFYDENGLKFPATNTDQVVDKIPNILGSKTGFTDLAGGNLVVAFDAGVNHPIVISVLGSSVNGRFTDVMELVKRTQDAISNMP